ncbi:MAG: hypothetical protein ACRCZF_27150 [Gemmataceae bacterium]
MMRTLMFCTLVALVAAGSATPADDKKGTTVEIAGLKGTTPADWKELEKPGMMRLTQFTLPKAEGDKDDADVSIFFFKGQAGTIEANLERQRKKFQPEMGKDKIEETLGKGKLGTFETTTQDLKGTFLKKPFPMAEKGDPMPSWQQTYVAFETKDGQYYIWILGPQKTITKHKKGFDEFLASFK